MIKQACIIPVSYQEEGQPARRLNPGDVVVIPPNVKHWYGAKKDSWVFTT